MRLESKELTRGPDGLVRITLKKPFADGTVAVDMDPLSLLCRLTASVPAPRFNTVRYAGVLAVNAKLRPRIVPKAANEAKPHEGPCELPRRESDEGPKRDEGGRYRPWPELLKRTFSVDVLECDTCQGRMKLVAMVTDDKSIARFLKKRT